MKYNQPPIPMSNELKQVLQSSLGTTEAGLINVLSKYDDNYCFGTLNQEASIALIHNTLDDFKRFSKFADSDEVIEYTAITDIYGGEMPIHDLIDFINECNG